eukprot:GHVS01061675.1.p1 GENE.GHVS01061675.1~~GHVS01061675.1.p1  ORF type:complete len:107 (-),score=8.09 GHVS01061675.1:659-979(-)
MVIANGVQSHSSVYKQARDAVRCDSPPSAVSRLIGDLKMSVAYRTANEWHEAEAMEKAFNSISWDDPAVLAAVPRYLKSTGPQRARVDYAYNGMFPTPTNPKDVKT